MIGRSPAVLALALAWAGCLASPPEVEGGGDVGGGELGSPFADAVLAVSDEAGTLRTCGDALPACEGEARIECGAAAALGPPDGQFLPLPEGGELVVAFRCSSVRERGGFDSADLRIWSRVPEGASAIVEVSASGGEYAVVGRLEMSDQHFDLAAAEGLEVVQFVQIAGASGGIEIDAIEALRGE